MKVSDIMTAYRHERRLDDVPSTRVDLDLAGKDVGDSWRRLEARLGAAELRARTARPQGAGSLAALVESATELCRGLRQKPAAVGRAAR